MQSASASEFELDDPPYGQALTIGGEFVVSALIVIAGDAACVTPVYAFCPPGQ
jgi:hypothetical protein